MRRLASLTSLPFLALSIAACADAGDPSDTDEVTAQDGTYDATEELRVRAGETTLWMTRGLTLRTDTPNGPAYVMRGRTSRDLRGGRAFIFDDVYGDFAKRSARVFEVTYPVSTARTLIDGVPVFVGVDLRPSAGRSDSMTARAIVRPRLDAFSGSSRIYLTAELTPVVTGGRVVYRIEGHTTSASDVISTVQVRIGDQWLTDTRNLDGRYFEIDLEADHVLALAGTHDVIEVQLPLPSGIATKRAELGLSIKRLGFTAGDVETVWPPIGCTTETRSCLEGLPDGTLDLGGCGEAIAVNACAGELGVFVTDEQFAATLAEADHRLSDPAFRADAIGLVGADRVEAFLEGARQTVERRLEDQFGRWYLSAATRDAALAAALDGGIDRAVARPMELIEPHPVVGAADVAGTRQVVADALLAHLATLDLRATEFSRPLEELARVYRAQHVASVRAFRETIAPEPYPGHPEWDVYIGNWLGAYVEVSVRKTDGSVANLLFEID
jgi:hypothetical protein